jgi:hypothetical protein
LSKNSESPPQSGSVPVIIGLLEVFKASIWPAIVLFIFLSLYTPVRSLLTELPNALGRADVISIGDFKVQLTKALEVNAPTDVREALKGLGSEGTERLLRLAIPAQQCEFKHPGAAERYAAQLAVDRQLQSRRLVEYEDQSSEDNSERSKCYLVSPTDLGKRTRDFLIGFLGTSLRLN